jgi:hypothetical protein
MAVVNIALITDYDAERPEAPTPDLAHDVLAVFGGTPSGSAAVPRHGRRFPEDRLAQGARRPRPTRGDSLR